MGLNSVAVSRLTQTWEVSISALPAVLTATLITAATLGVPLVSILGHF